jgi:hypothetical protein
MTEAEDQRREWNKTSEADIPQAEAKQPYRKRENDSASGLIDLSKSGHESKPRSAPKTDREISCPSLRSAFKGFKDFKPLRSYPARPLAQHTYYSCNDN